MEAFLNDLRNAYTQRWVGSVKFGSTYSTWPFKKLLGIIYQSLSQTQHWYSCFWVLEIVFLDYLELSFTLFGSPKLIDSLSHDTCTKSTLYTQFTLHLLSFKVFTFMVRQKKEFKEQRCWKNGRIQKRCTEIKRILWPRYQEKTETFWAKKKIYIYLLANRIFMLFFPDY